MNSLCRWGLICALGVFGFSRGVAQIGGGVPGSMVAGVIKAANVRGDVRKISLSDLSESALQNGDTLRQDHAVVTKGPASSAVLVFANGSTVRVGGDSRLEIKEFLMDPLQADVASVAALTSEPTASRTTLRLEFGEMVGNVKTLNRAAGSTFSVGTPAGAAGIRGTTFRVVYRPTGTGQAFNFQNQVYAGLGWAVLMVNYRGSIGYGQAWSDGVFRDQNGDEAQDVLYGVNAAIRRYTWIDRNRLGVEGGSYGGQLSAWLVTVTNIFKAAIPRWPIINLVSYNYMTYYPMYEEMEFGAKVHTADWLDQLWRRSSLRYVNGVKTPTLLMHGENDNDVPIAESEQFYMGLKDAGVETVMVRYPREGHGLREPKHTVDMIARSTAWYQKHFPK